MKPDHQNVAIVDVSPLGREELKNLLKSIQEGITCHEFAGIDEILHQNQCPLLLVLIEHTSLWRLVKPLETLHTKWPETRYVIGNFERFPNFEAQYHLLTKFLDSGLIGYFHHQVTMHQIHQVMYQALKGQRLVIRANADIPDKHSKTSGHLFKELTKREKEVLGLLCNNLDNAGVARQLAISKRTVETNRGSIVNKLKLETPFALAHPKYAEPLAYFIEASPSEHSRNSELSSPHQF